MTARTTLPMLALAAAAATVAGCSNSGAPFSTSSVAPEKVAAAPRVDPVCVSLASQIDTLRAEGSVDRLEKAAAGKTSNVQVKRASLAKQAELNKANSDFQARCGPNIPRAQTATTAPVYAAPPAVAPPPKVNAAAAKN